MFRKYLLINFFSDIYITFIRYLNGESGNKLRYKYYKKRLKYLGKDVIIDTGVFIEGAEYISIGDGTHIDKNCILVGCSPDLDLTHRILVELKNKDFNQIKGSIAIEKNCHLSQYVMVYGYGGVLIQNNCGLSANSKVYSLSSLPINPRNRRESVSILPFSGKSPTLLGAVVLKENSWLGVNCLVQPGVTIGKDSFIESNSIITASVDDNVYAGGYPLKIHNKRFYN